MMRITRFQKIKNHRIFRDFTWSATNLPDFARFNLIYGWNGAGKTTLSNLFRHLQRSELIREGEVGIVLDDGRTVTQADIETATLPSIRVFNRDTVDRSIFEVVGRELPPVYYLGEESAETQVKIEELKAQHGTIAIDVGILQHKYNEQQKKVEQIEIAQAKTIKNLLTGPESTYNNYDKGNFRSAAERLLKTSTIALERLTPIERDALLKTAHGTSMLKVSRPDATFPNVTELNKRVQALLERSLVSSVIEELQKDSEVSRWVASGLALHRGALGTPASFTCHFCKQSIPDGRLEHLEEHFNDQYAKFQAEISQLLKDVITAREQTKLVTFPDKGLLYPDLREAYVEQVQKFKQLAYTSDTYFQMVHRALTAKQNEPFRKLDLMQFVASNSPDGEERGTLRAFIEGVLFVGANFSALYGTAGFNKACSLIDQHNEQTDNFGVKQQGVRVTLAQDSVLEVLEDYNNQRINLGAVLEQQKTLNAQRIELQKQIATLEKSIRLHQPAAEELTRDMASYLGRKELRFEARDVGYVITRNGQPAMHLSEGERTAIAFMYFLKSLEDTNFNLIAGIVVIDDPVSSLDANSLYCAFGFMKARIQKAHQVFVLTHNFTFFRQVKNWFHYVSKQKKSTDPVKQYMKSTQYYMLRGIQTPQGRSALIQPMDDLLVRFESEYHHMFKLVLEASRATTETPMSELYALPNLARRLLEAVLAFKQPGKSGELYQQFKDITFEESKKARILMFTNTYSHHGLMPEPAHDLSILAETPEVLRDVLDLVKHLDADHFESMSALCEAVTTSGST